MELKSISKEIENKTIQDKIYDFSVTTVYL
jgi:hypothetical protein